MGSMSQAPSDRSPLPPDPERGAYDAATIDVTEYRRPGDTP